MSALVLVADVRSNPGLASQAMNVISMEHVRTADRRIHYALTVGLTASPTLRDLVWEIDHSDVIVYIEDGRCQELQPDGCLFIAAASGKRRYVRVRVNARRATHELVQMLGHELQHVVEIARESEVTEASSLAELYARIGYRRGRARAFETRAAIAIGETVLAEFKAHAAGMRASANRRAQR